MGFLDGFARGMQLAQQAVQMREGIAERAQQKEWALEDRRRATLTGDRQADLQTLQLEQARRDAARNEALAAAEKEVQTAGKVALQTEFMPGKKEGELEQVFIVGQQRFNNRADAQVALETANLPVQVARRQYQAAQATGIADVQQKYLGNYNAVRTATEAEFKQTFMDAARNGGVDGVLGVYNSNVKDGRQMVSQRRPDGKLVIGTYMGGKLQGEPVVYENDQQFMAEQVARYAASPDAYLDFFQKGETRREGIRQFDTKMRQDADQFDRRLTEETRQSTERNAIGRAQVGVGMAQVGVQRDALNKPTMQILPTVTPDGNTTFGAGIVRLDAKGGAKAEYLPLGTQPGMRNPPKPDALGALLQGRAGAPGAPGAPKAAGFPLDDNGLARLDALMNK